MNNKLPEWRKTLNKSVENYQSTRAWYEENRDSPAALDDMERAEHQLANFVRKCGFSIVLSLLDEIDELQELHRSCLALRGEIEDVQEQLYEAENRNNADNEELQERRKADNQEPAGYHVIKECGRVGCSVATLEEAEKTRDFWNKRWTIRPYFYTQPALVATGATNSPVTPDGWISCSERMPEDDESKPIAIFTGNCLGQGMFVATYDDDGFFDFWEGMEIIGVTHWMPLPEPPQQ